MMNKYLLLAITLHWSYFIQPTIAQHRTSGQDVYMNFMDYVNDSYMSNFTADQTTIMQTVDAPQSAWATDIPIAATANSTDNDGDGIADDVDIDDDNDGITDIVEGYECNTTALDGRWVVRYWNAPGCTDHSIVPLTYNSAGQEVYFTDIDEYGLPHHTVPPTAEFMWDAFVDLTREFDVSTTELFFAEGWIYFPEELNGLEIEIRMKQYGPLVNAIWVISSDDDPVNWQDPIRVSDGQPLLDMEETLGIPAPIGAANYNSPYAQVPPSLVSDRREISPFTTFITVRPEGHYYRQCYKDEIVSHSVKLMEYRLPGQEWQDIPRSFVASSRIRNCTARDTDSDGIPDYQDGDSDNDGCPDAIEGGADFTDEDLDEDGRLIGGVNANGLPIATGAPQTEGTAYDGTQSSDDCAAACEPSSAVLATDLVQNGFAVYTCFSGTSQQDGTDTDPVMGIRNYQNAGTLFNNASYIGNVPTIAQSNSNFPVVKMFTKGDFGGHDIAGTAIDNRDGSIYTHTSVLHSFQHTRDRQDIARVYKITPDGSQIQTVATLPGNRAIGWITLDEQHNRLFVSNMDDGQIYGIKLNDGLNQTTGFTTFAPHTASAINGSFPPLGRRIFGVGYNPTENRLYYAIWANDARNIGLGNTLRSVGLSDTGDFLPSTDRLEYTLPAFGGGIMNTFQQSVAGLENGSMPISDIVFSRDGTKMLISEKTMDQNIIEAAHCSRVIELNGASGSWVAENKNKFQFLSTSDPHRFNHGGGVSFAYGSTTDFSDAPVDPTHLIGSTDFIFSSYYGAQYMSLAGGTSYDALVVDNVDGIGYLEKGTYWEIDIRMSPQIECEECNLEVAINPVNQTICQGETLGTITANVTGNDGAVTYQWYNDNGPNNPTVNAIIGQNTAILTNIPTQIGSYNYRVIAASIEDASCSAETTFSIIISECSDCPEGTPDSDGDGIDDECDLDDDNDGILDTDEGHSCINESTNLLSNFADGTFEVLSSVASSDSFNSNVTSGAWQNGQGSADTWISPMPITGVGIWNGLADGMPPSNQGGIFAAARAVFEVGGTLAESFYVDITGLTVGATYRLTFEQANAGTDESVAIGELTRWKVMAGTETLYTNPMPYLGQGNQRWENAAFDITPNSPNLRLEFFGDTNGSSLAGTEEIAEYMAIDDIQLIATNVNGSADCTEIDTDNDGIPNHLDVDSDNDGCPDAIEGSGAITFNDLNVNTQIAGGISEEGVPTIIGVGQGVGTAYNANTTATVCEVGPCDTPNPINTDTDGDGIVDDCDLDDDNDGILDEVEGCVFCNDNTFLNESFEAGQTHQSFVQVPETSVLGWETTASDNRIEIWRSGFSGVGSQNGSYHAEINSSHNAALYQRICTRPGSLISWSVWHRGRSGVDVGVVKIGADLNVAEVQATMSTNNTGWQRYSGTYAVPDNQVTTLLIFEAISTASGNPSIGNFIDNIEIVELNPGTCLDTDNDGIPNYLDNDSDNDGCPDAIEGSGNITLDDINANGQINGTISEEGVPTLIGAGQGIGTAYDADESPENCTPTLIAVDAFSQTTCLDNGTSSNPSDDYFTVTVSANIEGTATTDQYQVVINANGDGTGGTVLGTQNYGTSITIGTDGRFIADSGTNYLITIRDAIDNTKFHNIITRPVSACSFICDITAALEPPVYNDNGTPNDLTDDTYTVVATISNNTAASTQGWEVNGMTGQYGQPTTFGPYPVDQRQTIRITDITSGGACAVDVMVNMESCVYTGECECCK